MIDDVMHIIERGIHSLHDALPEIKKFASSDDWRKRKDATTALVEISKKREDEVVSEMIIWAELTKDPDHETYNTIKNLSQSKYGGTHG